MVNEKVHCIELFILYKIIINTVSHVISNVFVFVNSFTVLYTGFYSL